MKTLNQLVLFAVFNAFVSLPFTTVAQDAALLDAQRAALATWSPLGDELNNKGREAYPMLARFLTTNDCSSLGNELCDELVFLWLIRRDGWNMLAESDPKMLAATRSVMVKILKKDNIYETMAIRNALIYLCQKGTAHEVPIMERYLLRPDVQTNEYLRTSVVGMPHRILQARVAGTNIVNGMFDSKLYPYPLNGLGDAYTTNDIRFIPSVANTGPQATYVYQAFVRAIFKESRVDNEDFYNSMFNHIPPEMLTMQVWFDKEGNAVTDVDLSKYGVSVPGLGFATNAPPNVRAEKPVMEVSKDSKPPQAGSPRSWALPIVGFLLSAAVIISIYFKRRK